jgi:glycosyltransferase involved in cell wall biosynthesis
MTASEETASSRGSVKRIAVDVTALLPESTGVDHYTKRLVVNLGKVDQRNQYKIFVNFEDRRVFEGLLPRNFEVVPLSLRPRPVRFLFQHVLLPLLARRWRADVVHSPVLIMPLYRGKRRHVLTIHDMTLFSLPHCHDTLHRSALYRHLVLRSIRHADLIFVPSRATQADVCRVVRDISPRRVRIIPLGVSEEFRLYSADETCAAVRRLQLPARYILYVGAINPRKNLQRLVESYRRLVSKSEIEEHLVLAGQLGWGYQDLLKQLDSPDLRGKVHLTGYVPQSDLPWLYAGATIFVYPSLQEGFGLPPLEAMACGVPTISSLSSSLTENLQGAAELVPPEDIEALTDAMRRLLQDESLRAKRREQGLERAARFCWKETARQTLDCYCEAATGQGSE